MDTLGILCLVVQRMGSELWQAIAAGVAALLIGLTKAGFGTGLGMLTTPLSVFAFGPRKAIGVLLPMLVVGDFFSLLAYWRRWDVNNLFYLLPGVFIGIAAGIQMIDAFSAAQLNRIIGAIACGFALFQWFRDLILEHEKPFRPSWVLGLLFGAAAGFTSTVAHGAGPIVTMFLYPQRLPKTLFVGTNVLIFTCINWLKVPFYCIDQSVLPLAWLPKEAIINFETLRWSGLFAPIVPIGVCLGVWLNKRIAEQLFNRVVLLLLLLAGLHLLLQLDLSVALRWLIASNTS